MTSNKKRPPTITRAHPPLPLGELTDLIKDFHGAATSRKQETIRRLVAAHPILNLKWGPEWRYRRARLLRDDEVPETVDEVIWRKGVPASLGRANPAGFQVLYLADRVETALSEVRAVDQSAMIAEFVILPGRQIHLAPIGELARIQRTGRGYLSGSASSGINDLLNACDLDEAKSLLITDAFLFECLTNPDDDYELSSSVVMAIYDKNPAISAVAYASRRQLGAINFAVRIERFWEDWGLISVRRGRATHLALGYYRFDDIRHADGIMKSGRLVWNDEPQVEQSVALLDPPWTPA